MLDEQAIQFLLAALLAVAVVIMFVRILGAPSKRGKRRRFDGDNARDSIERDEGRRQVWNRRRRDGDSAGDGGGGTDSGGDGGGGD